MKLYSSFEAAKVLNVHQNTLRRWRETNVFIPVSRTAGGHFRYSEEQIEQARNGVFNVVNLESLLG